MMIFKNDKEKRENQNYLIYDSLKLQLASFPNYEFNKYVLNFVKTFIKNGRLEKIKRYGIYTLFVHNRDYDGFVMVNNANKEITMSISPVLKNDTQTMTKKVKFNKNVIIILDKSKYESSEETLLESTSCSIFKNSCLVNALGDNNLVFRETKEIQTENNQNKECTSLMRVKKDGEALGEMWNSEEQKRIYFKDQNIFITFEDFLINGFSPLESAILSDESFDENNRFVNRWLEENYEAEEISKKII